MRKQKFALCLAGLLLIPATAFVAPSAANALYRPDDAKEYKIERTFKKGEKDRYNIVLKFNGSNPTLGGDFKLTMDMILRETVKEVKDGVAEYESEFEQALANLGGGEQDLSSQFPQATFKADKSGRMWNVKVKGGDALLQGGGGGKEQLISVVRAMFYPAKAVKIGDTWDVLVTNPDTKDKEGKEITQAKGKATVIGTEKIAGFDGLKIKVTSDITLDPKEKMPLKFEGDGILDSVSGKILIVKGSMDGTLPQIGKSTADVSISLMKEDPKIDVRDKKKDK